MLRRLTIIATTSALIAVPALAQGLAGGLPGSFLRYGSSARSLAMGGACMGLADDASAMYFNPAGLEQVRSTELILFHTQLFEATHYSFAGIVQPLGGLGTIGLSGTLLSSSGYERSTALEDLDETFGETQNAIQVSFARAFGPLMLGTTWKMINQSIADFSGSGTGIDLSMFSRPWRYLSVGISAQNIAAPSIMLREGVDKYPLSLRAGGAVHLRGGRVLAAVDVAKTGTAPPSLFAGLEVRALSSFALRGGYNLRQNAYSAGAGYRQSAWQIDYAVSDSPLGLSHRASLIWRFGAPRGVHIRSDVDRFSPSGEQREVTLSLKSRFRAQPRRWRLLVSDDEGEPRFSTAGQGTPPETYTWDGRDSNGRLLPSGLYRVVLVVIDEFGDPWSRDTEVEIRDYDKQLLNPIQMDLN